MKRFFILLVVFLISFQQAEAFNALEKLDQNQTYLCICIKGDATLRNWTPPLNPFNDSSIQKVYVIMPYNKTHVWTISYSPSGAKTEKPDQYYSNTPKLPFNITDWNLSKVLKEYQWGVENYLPNISGKFSVGEWEKGHWNSTIEKWNAIITSNHLQITLHTFSCGGSGECDEYITFECWRNETNVTCKWGKPVFKTYPGPPVNGKIPGKETKTTSTSTTTRTTSTTSRTTSAPSSTQSTTPTKEEKLCGPALIVGLALIPVLVKKRRE